MNDSLLVSFLAAVAMILNTVGKGGLSVEAAMINVVNLEYPEFDNPDGKKALIDAFQAVIKVGWNYENSLPK